MLLQDGATFAAQKTFIREDADPTEDCEPARDALALEYVLARQRSGVGRLPGYLLELYEDERFWGDYRDDGWGDDSVHVDWNVALAADAWYWWRDDPHTTLEEIWSAVFLDPPETFLGGHSGMSRTNLSRRSRSA